MPGSLAEGRTAMNMIAPRYLSRGQDFPGSVTAVQQGVVVIVSDELATIENLAPICEFLELRVEVVSAGTDLGKVLREYHPMAVICDVEGQDMDGFHAMKVIARYKLDLPIMLLTDGDAVLMGAADAVQELWKLTSVTRSSGFPMAGQLVGFLSGAGRRAGCVHLVPV
jgi:CheY-like chemotaxis protein